MIAVCDHKGCGSKCKATVKLQLKQAVKGVQNPITLQPSDIVFDEDGWSWGWNSEETVMACPGHKVKR